MTFPPAISGAACRQHRRDVLVRQAVKPVSLDTRLSDVLGQRHQLGDRRLSAMEARVEAGDLRHAWQPRRGRVDRGEVVRLVERGQRDEIAKVLQHLGGDERRAGVARATVHHAMADAEHARSPVARTKPGRELIERGTRVAHGLAERPLIEGRARGVLRGEPRGGPDAVDLPACLELPDVRLRRVIHAELQARRARVQHDGVGVHHACPRPSREPPHGARAPRASRRRSSRCASARCRHGSSG